MNTHRDAQHTGQRDGEKPNALLHPSHPHKRVEETSSSELQAPLLADKIQRWTIADLTREGCLQLQELPADAEPKRETLTAAGQPAGSFQELLEEGRELQRALLTPAACRRGQENS